MIEQKAEPVRMWCNNEKNINNVGVATKVSMVFNPYTINAHRGQKQSNNFVEIFRPKEFFKKTIWRINFQQIITDNSPSNIV